MNLRLGRFGLQESACAVGLGALISGSFAVNVGDTFARGNVSYAATAAGVLLSLLLLRLLGGAMTHCQTEDLSALILDGWGTVPGGVLALPLALGLLLAAALPLFRFTLAMERYIFVEADYVPIVLYLLPVLLLLVLCGMECVGRMAKLLFLPGAVALLSTLLLAAPAFDCSHLFPLFSPGFSAFVNQTGEALFRFLLPGLALFAVGQGCQGRKHLFGGIDRGTHLGGLVALSLHLGLGLTFYGPDLASMSAPVYCMTMAARQKRLVLRFDVLVLFLWVMAGLVAAAFYIYAAALLLCRALHIGDVRPVGALMVLLNLPWAGEELDLALYAVGRPKRNWRAGIFTCEITLEADLEQPAKLNTETEPLIEAIEGHLAEELNRVYTATAAVGADVFAVGKEAIASFSSWGTWQAYEFFRHLKDMKAVFTVRVKLSHNPRDPALE